MAPMTRHLLLRALFVVLVAGGVILIVSGAADDRAGRLWTGIGLVVASVVCLVAMLAPKLRMERARLDVALANPDAMFFFGQLDEDLTGASSVLVADTSSVRVLATRDRAVSVELPWRDVTGASIRVQRTAGAEKLTRWSSVSPPERP